MQVQIKDAHKQKEILFSLNNSYISVSRWSRLGPREMPRPANGPAKPKTAKPDEEIWFKTLGEPGVRSSDPTTPRAPADWGKSAETPPGVSLQFHSIPERGVCGPLVSPFAI